MESSIRLQRQLYVCSLDARSVSSYPYNWLQMLQYVKYVKYTKSIKMQKKMQKYVTNNVFWLKTRKNKTLK